MFDSVKRWFHQLDQESHLFEHGDDEAVHIALASLLYHIISADNLESDKEQQKFYEILAQEFHLSEQQISMLYQNVKALQTDFHDDLNTINEHLTHKPQLRMIFMQKLIHLMSLDGVTENELNIFHDAMVIVFPELNDGKRLA